MKDLLIFKIAMVNILVCIMTIPLLSTTSYTEYISTKAKPKKILVQLKNGQEYAQYLIKIDSHKVYLFDSKKYMAEALNQNCNSCLAIPIEDIEKIEFPKNNSRNKVLGWIVGIVAFLGSALLGLATSNAFYVDCESNCNDISMLIYLSPLIGIGLGMLVSNSVQVEDQLIPQNDIYEILKEDAYEYLLDEAFHLSRYNEQAYIKLMQSGKFSKFQQYEFKFWDGRKIIGYLKKRDESSFYVLPESIEDHNSELLVQIPIDHLEKVIKNK